MPHGWTVGGDTSCVAGTSGVVEPQTWPAGGGSSVRIWACWRGSPGGHGVWQGSAQWSGTSLRSGSLDSAIPPTNLCFAPIVWTLPVDGADS